MSEPSLDLVVLGLSLSSAWGNGHATTYRALLRAFAERGHRVTFLERDVAWYGGAHRDLEHPDFCRLLFYDGLEDLRRHAEIVRDADVVMVGSYVPQGVEVGVWAQATANGLVAFYDIDTPITVTKLESGDYEYVSPAIIPEYDLYLSFTGGPMLERLEREFGARAAVPLYCSVDADAYRRVETAGRWDLSYLGTYSPDRQPKLERLLLAAAREAPHLRFAVAGAQFPQDLAWPANVERIEHVAPCDHPLFYSQSRYTLNITRADMIAAGYSPSVRLFEAAACGTPLISDDWPGLDNLFTAGSEIFIAQDQRDVLAVLTGAEALRLDVADRARRRTLAAHTSRQRAAELERAFIACKARTVAA